MKQDGGSIDEELERRKEIESSKPNESEKRKNRRENRKNEIAWKAGARSVSNLNDHYRPRLARPGFQELNGRGRCKR